MYNNEPFDDYIRSILGYPNPNTMYVPESNNYNSYANYTGNNLNEDVKILEQCYPEIYRIVYPMIKNRCSRVTEPITKDLINDITNEIYSSIEVTNEVNLSINLKNEVSNNNNRDGKKDEVKKENREDRQGNGLRDLIRILLIRELIRNRKPRPRPPMQPRPPFSPERPGMSQIRPRYDYMDIYEN